MDGEALNIQVDLSRSRLSDWNLIASVQAGNLDLAQLLAWLEFLDRVLVGGADQYPMDQLPAVIKAVAAALAEKANPKAPAA